jgi:hypothetical protein
VHAFLTAAQELASMVTFASGQRQVAKRELVAANRRLDAAIRGRDWSANALRESGRRISLDAVIGLYGRVVLHCDRVVTPSGTFALTREVTAGVETARVIAANDRLATNGELAEAARRADPRRLFLFIAAPDGRHLEPCRPDELLKARVFASRLVSAARTRDFDVDAATRLRDLGSRYESLDGPDSSVGRALAELRELEARLSDDDGLPRRYRLRAEPARLPRFAS